MINNILVLQSGGCTPVINTSLMGICLRANETKGFGNIYGALHGLDGILSEELTTLDCISKPLWKKIAKTPGAALGSTRSKLRDDDIPLVFENLGKHNIRFVFIIGGNDSAQTGHTLSTNAKTTGYPLTVINVPKTIDNDLAITDHCPGYGSAARFIALATMGAGRDAEAMGKESPITIIEVMGRDTGWLAGASALGKRTDRDAPHIICIPESPIDENRFVGSVEKIYGRLGFAVVVVAENTRGVNGVIGGSSEPEHVDDFGHPYYEGPGRYLAWAISSNLKVRGRYEKPGTIQRSFVNCVSQTDVREAESVGRAAVDYALAGYGDYMVTLIREPGEPYTCKTGLARLDEVAGFIKAVPPEYFDPSTTFITDQFLHYARPLSGVALPKFERLY